MLGNDFFKDLQKLPVLSGFPELQSRLGSTFKALRTRIGSGGSGLIRAAEALFVHIRRSFGVDLCNKALRKESKYEPIQGRNLLKCWQPLNRLVPALVPLGFPCQCILMSFSVSRQMQAAPKLIQVWIYWLFLPTWSPDSRMKTASVLERYSADKTQISIWLFWIARTTSFV